MSFILLGILNAQAEAAGIVSDYELLETTILDSSASSVSFTGLGSYSDYKHLQIRYTARLDRVADGDVLNLNFNSDTTASYAWHRLQGDGSSVSSSAGTSQTYLRAGIAAASNGATGVFSGSVIDILDFSSTSKNTTTRTLGGVLSNNLDDIRLVSGLYNKTDAITSLTLVGNGADDFVAGSRFSLYGLKESV